MLEGKHPVPFKERTDMLFMRRETLPFHYQWRAAHRVCR